MPAQTLSADEIIRARRSIRRFLPTPVPLDAVREILDVAARAPSGTNVQPWKVYALAGAEKDALAQAIIEKNLASGAEPMEFDYYPKQWVDPWLSRRRKVGIDMYGLLGIVKGDKETMTRQWLRNYVFFDAPVGLIFTIDRIFGVGMLLDYGMFLQTLMLAARARGLDTCTQLAFADYPQTIRRILDLPENEKVICGMALGHADPDAPENQQKTDRVPAGGFTEFRGFATPGED
ncbi:MAG: nitroreductase [Candidatus Accumulibacter sp.]|jgi:nitroreductase|nr:nitroreductase [Accumulibacter sp.]